VLISAGRPYRRVSAVREADKTPLGIAVGVGAVAMMVAGVVASLIPAAYPGWRFGVVAFAVFLFAAASLDQVALAIVALIGGLVFNGFLEDSYGQLAWHGGHDLWRLLLLVMVAAWGLAVGEGYRFVRDLRVRYRMVDNAALSAPSIEEEKHGA
jgi:MFS family permease